MHSAAYHDNHYLIVFLRKKGFDLEERDKDGNTPLHVACAQKSDKVAEMLMGLGVDVNLVNDQG